MTIKCMDDIDATCLFGIKLFKLAETNKLIGTQAIAEALYLNDECYKILKPNTSKYESTRKKDILSISKSVLRHFESTTVFNVDNRYLLAYCKLFNCSMDYLFDIIDEPAPNAKVKDVSNKYGLSYIALDNLEKDSVIDLDESIELLERYHLLLDYDFSDDLEISIREFWNDLLESDIFFKIPELWYKMTIANYVDKQVDFVKKDLKRNRHKKPELNSFLSHVEEYNVFHPHHMVFCPYSSYEEAYEKDNHWVMEVWHDIFCLNGLLDVDTNTTYYGYSGKFDRFILNYFHAIEEKWCENGPLPPLFFKR